MGLEEIKYKYITALQEEIEEIDFSTINCNEPIVEKYGINSFYIVQMVICAEDIFDIFFEDEELITTNYKTLNDIFIVIQKKIEEAD